MGDRVRVDGRFLGLAVTCSVEGDPRCAALEPALGALLATPRDDVADVPGDRVEIRILCRPFGFDGKVEERHVTRRVTGGGYAAGAPVFTGTLELSTGDGPVLHRIEIEVEPDVGYALSAVRVLMGPVLYRYSMFYLHAGAVSVDGRARAYVGPAGAGKTTMVSAMSRFLAGASPVHDDTVFLFQGPFGTRLSSDPFHVQDGLPASSPSLPLEVVFFLAGKGRNGLVRLDPATALVRVASEAMGAFESGGQTRAMLAAVERVVSSVPVFDCWWANDDEGLSLLERGWSEGL